MSHINNGPMTLDSVLNGSEAPKFLTDYRSPTSGLLTDYEFVSPNACDDSTVAFQVNVEVTDLNTSRVKRKIVINVTRQTHVGGLMIKIVDQLDVAMDWSDYALWWPSSNKWLVKTRWTLDEYSMSEATDLLFTPMHKSLRIALPDLRLIDCQVDFSKPMFEALAKLCPSTLNIKHPEEISLHRILIASDLKSNFADWSDDSIRRFKESDIVDRVAVSAKAFRENSPVVGSGVAMKNASSHKVVIEGRDKQTKLTHSPMPHPSVRGEQIHPKTLVDRARINVAWLDSSLSLMQQHVREGDTLALKFKYHAFQDLKVVNEGARVNMIFEQARWQLLNECVDCTEEEMLMFAALQLQVSIEAHKHDPYESMSKDISSSSSGSSAGHGGLTEDESDIDGALHQLEVALGQTSPCVLTSANPDNTRLNGGQGTTGGGPFSLEGYINYVVPKRFTMNSLSRLYFVCTPTRLSGYKSSNASVSHHTNEDGSSSPIVSIELRGCEVIPDVNLGSRRYQIRLEVPSNDGMSEMKFKFNNEMEYCRWMAAFTLASKSSHHVKSSHNNSNSLPPSSQHMFTEQHFNGEVKAIQAFLAMQQPSTNAATSRSVSGHGSVEDIDVTDFVSARFAANKKFRSKNLRQRILEAHTNVKELNLLEAKMNFIKAWQSLPDFGVTLFIVRFLGEKRDELLGITANRLMRINLQTGDHVKTWRFSTVKAWNVNWKSKHMMIQVEDERHPDVIFNCLSADVKVVHEFIGGYIFMSLRNSASNSKNCLDHQLFYKLTSGWS